ncbi:hypothetical protein LBMAG30_01550 [Comamonadaceae bacterium]|nr:hypothetical protein LBMAG30_01550 [Comamonadaceae bacterium]
MLPARGLPSFKPELEHNPMTVEAPPPAKTVQPAYLKSSAGTLSGRVAVVVLFEVLPRHRLWGYSCFVRGPKALADPPGLVFAKVLGSGHQGGFGLQPSGSRQARFCLFDQEQEADNFLASPLVQGYARRSGEFFSAKLRAYSCRGSWSGANIEVTAEAPSAGPIMSLTRASIRPSRARQFWRMQPASELALAQSQGCLMATGVGEAPFLRQATLTVWSDVAAMDNYARSGAHLAAIQAAYGGGFFSESMFARFSPLALRGVWRGRTFGS